MRTLEWDGYINARDLGGLPTVLSATGNTKYSRLARGPRRERLTALGWDQARGWGLTTIVDLRCAHERGVREYDPDVSDTARTNVTVIGASTEDQDDPEFQRTCMPILDSPEYWQHNWRLQPSLVRHALEVIAASPAGILVHCSAGRDRTGMISALLLGNAEVNPAAVVSDYMESVHAMAGVANHAPTADRQADWTHSEVDEWLRDKVSIVYEVAAHAQEALDIIGLRQDVRTKLRALLIA